MKPIYLDYAAATPLDPQVKLIMDEAQAEYFYNPSATYGSAGATKQKIEESKKLIAHHLGAKPTEIILTSGGSESNNLAIRGALEANPGSKILVSAIEHESVLEPASLYQNQLLKVDKNGFVDLGDLSKKITDDVVLVSVAQANNEIGTIQHLKQISQIIEETRRKRAKRGVARPLYLHSDSCQAADSLDIHVHSLGVDLMSINGGKIYGPKQAGVLYVGTNVKLKPQILGGGQQRGLRSGSQDAANAVGLAKALDIAQSIKAGESKRVQALRDKLVKAISKSFPSAQINGSTKHRLGSNLNISFPSQSSERLLIMLEEKGVLASAGSACGASKDEASHVLLAIGLDEAAANSSLRFSLGRSTTDKDIDQTIKALKAIFGGVA